MESDDDEFPTKGIPMSLILQYGKDEDIAEVRKKEEQCLKNNEFKNDDVSLLVHDTTTDRPLKRPISKAYWYGPDMSPPEPIQDCDTKSVMNAVKIKKYACPVRGCTKSYKNPNGMKYHVMNSHDLNGNFIKPVKEKKEYKCSYCSKEYKTFRGLQTHIQAHQQPSPQPQSEIQPSLIMQHHGVPYYPNVEPSHLYDQDHMRQQANISHGLPNVTSAKFKRDYFLHKRYLKNNDGIDYPGEHFQSSMPSSYNSTSTAANEYFKSRHFDPVVMRRNPYLSIEGPVASQRMMLQHQLTSPGASNVLHKQTCDGPPAAQGSSTCEEYYPISNHADAGSNVGPRRAVPKWVYDKSDYYGGSKQNCEDIASHQDNYVEYNPMNMHIAQLKNQMIQQHIYERQGMPRVANHTEDNDCIHERLNIRRNLSQHLQNVPNYHQLDTIKRKRIDFEETAEAQYKQKEPRTGDIYD